jgi:1-acyl-sn-glycerol-3-phosphate acyltransferase
MGVRVPLRARILSFWSIRNYKVPMSSPSSPSLLRWILVGVPCYGSWVLANLALLMLFPLFYLIELLGGRQGRQLLRHICTSFVRFFFLRHLPFVGVYRVERSPDLDRLKQTRRCLVVANHTSWLDALILFALIPRVRILVSTRYRNVPLVRHTMRWLECIFIDRRSRESVMSSLEEIRAGLEKEDPIAVFPEGTRAEVGQLRPFRDIFFRIASDTQMPIQPVLLYIDQPFLGPGAENFLTRTRATLRIRMLEPIAPDPRERARDLAFRSRSAMKRALEQLTAATEPCGEDDE